MPDCIFCKIVGGEIPSAILYENEHVIAIDDIRPVAKIHSLIITKRHYDSILSPDPEDAGLLGGVMRAVREVAAIKGVAESGFRLISNCGVEGGQTVPHLHFHIIGGQPLGARIV